MQNYKSMAIYIYNGLPGMGKTTKLASIGLELLDRNVKLFKNMERLGKPRRLVVSNMKFSKEVEEKYGYGTEDSYIVYWETLGELIKYKHCDILMDEVATYLDSTLWKETNPKVKRFLQQHRHYGVNIFGTTQDFKTVDISMRRLTKKAFWVRKMFGSRDISETLPDVKNPYGLIMIREIEYDSFVNDAQDYKFYLIPELLWINKKLVNCFDTTQDIINNEEVPLRHVTKKCHECGKYEIKHY